MIGIVANTTHTDTHPAKFLVVDDHAGVRRTIREFLPAGEVTECADGEEALSRYASEHPDWVLMDIEMGGMDGLTATRRLKARFPEARVIIVSDHGDEEFRKAARDMGVCGFIHKEHLEQLQLLFCANTDIHEI
jgi:DNA-binding NarL/FixJ family response regulator